MKRNHHISFVGRFVIVTLGVILGTVLQSQRTQADQLVSNSWEDCHHAAEYLRRSGIMISFCSVCAEEDSLLEVVRIKEVQIVQDCYNFYAVEVTGTVIARWPEAYLESCPADPPFELINEPYKDTIDLAYAYIETSTNLFNCLGDVLDLEPDVNIHSLTLPPDIYVWMKTFRD